MSDCVFFSRFDENPMLSNMYEFDTPVEFGWGTFWSCEAAYYGAIYLTCCPLLCSKKIEALCIAKRVEKIGWLDVITKCVNGKTVQTIDWLGSLTKCTNGQIAQRIGGKLKSCLKSELSPDLRRLILLKVNEIKFALPEFRSLLLSTGMKHLVEATKHPIWGCGAKHEAARNPDNWKGKNWMGGVLERIRSVLRGDKFRLVIGDSIVRNLPIAHRTDIVAWGGCTTNRLLNFLKLFAGSHYSRVVFHVGICSISVRKKGKFIVQNLNVPKRRAQFEVFVRRMAQAHPTVLFFYSSVIPRVDGLKLKFQKCLKTHNNACKQSIDNLFLSNLFMIRHLNFSKTDKLWKYDGVHLDRIGQQLLAANIKQYALAASLADLAEKRVFVCK